MFLDTEFKFKIQNISLKSLKKNLKFNSGSKHCVEEKWRILIKYLEIESLSGRGTFRFHSATFSSHNEFSRVPTTNEQTKKQVRQRTNEGRPDNARERISTFDRVALSVFTVGRDYMKAGGIAEPWRSPHRTASGRSVSNVKRCIHLDSRSFARDLTKNFPVSQRERESLRLGESTGRMDGQADKRTNGRLMAIAILGRYRRDNGSLTVSRLRQDAILNPRANHDENTRTRFDPRVESYPFRKLSLSLLRG